MRFAVFADIHANWPALDAAYRDASAHNVEAIYFLGDLFGRGPHPIRCAQFLRQLVYVDDGAWVAGNHDWMVLNRLDAPIQFPEYDYASVGSEIGRAHV